jgi:5-methylcytosine-specific restriction endonuclease McrA
MGKGLHRDRSRKERQMPLPPGLGIMQGDAAKEREKARELRQSQWWKNQIAQGICYYCKKKFPPSELTMDHVIPVARGGQSDRHNVVPCCKICNNNKKYLTPAEQVLETLELDEDVE